MKWFHSLNFKRILMHFSTSYTLFILIPVLVLNVGYHQAIRITEENAIQNNMGALSQCCMLIDSKLKDIDAISPQIFFNKELLDLQYLGQEKRTVDYYSIWKGIQTFRNLNFITKDLYASVYYNNSDLFLSSDFLCNDMEKEYGILYRFGNLTFQEFKEKYRTQSLGKAFFPNTNLLWNGHSYRGVLYAMPISPEACATVYFLLEEEHIVEPLTPILNRGGRIYILDSQNELLFSRGVGTQETVVSFDLPITQTKGALSESFFGKDNVATYDISDFGLKYIAVMPKSVVFSQVKYLSFLTIYLNAVAVALAVSWAFYLAFKNSKRLVGILDSAGSSPVLTEYQGGNIFDYLSNSVLQLISSNQSLHSNAQTHLPILKAAFLNKLVNHSFSDDTELKNLEEKLGLRLDGYHFCVIAVYLEDDGYSGPSMGTIESIEQFAAKKQYVLSRLETDFEERGYIYSNSIDQIVIICRFLQEEVPCYRQIAEKMMMQSMNAIYVQTGILSKCVGSGVFGDVKKVFENYTLCRELFLRYSFIENENVIMWNDPAVNYNQNMFEYPAEFEIKLLHQIKAGEKAGAQSSIRGIFKKNFEEQVLSSEMKRLFVSQLTITLLKALDASMSLKYEERIFNINSIKSADALLSHILVIVGEICEIYVQRSDSRSASVKKEMVAFVEENFKNPELSLKYMSERFGLSDAYFSQLFKELAGKNFSVYLDKVRMQRAHALLQESQLRIDDIAQQCGYLATSTFRRAYKRYYGVSPSQNRNLTG